jgi:hypothetical protein
MEAFLAWLVLALMFRLSPNQKRWCEPRCDQSKCKTLRELPPVMMRSLLGRFDEPRKKC